MRSRSIASMLSIIDDSAILFFMDNGSSTGRTHNINITKAVGEMQSVFADREL